MPLSETETNELEETLRMLQDNYNTAVSALIRIAAFDDHTANRTLKNHQSYSSFDEPGAVRLARETLKLINEGPEKNV